MKIQDVAMQIRPLTRRARRVVDYGVPGTRLQGRQGDQLNHIRGFPRKAPLNGTKIGRAVQNTQQQQMFHWTLCLL